MSNLIAIMVIGILQVLVAWYCWWKVRKAYRSRDWMQGQLIESTRNFSRTKHSIIEAMATLRKQLETAETAKADAEAQVQYDKQEMTRFLASYKKLETNLRDTNTRYNNLQLQYNSLTSKMPHDGEMPI